MDEVAPLPLLCHNAELRPREARHHERERAVSARELQDARAQHGYERSARELQDARSMAIQRESSRRARSMALHMQARAAHGSASLFYLHLESGVLHEGDAL